MFVKPVIQPKLHFSQNNFASLASAILECFVMTVMTRDDNKQFHWPLPHLHRLSAYGFSKGTHSVFVYRNNSHPIYIGLNGGNFPKILECHLSLQKRLF